MAGGLSKGSPRPCPAAHRCRPAPERPASNEPAYLIPLDVARLDAYVWAQAISLERIVEILADRAPNAAQFVIFDACRNILRLPVRGTKGFAPVSEKRGMLIAFST
jgi:hypothetical protein